MYSVVVGGWTFIVLIPEDLRPEKGNTSGDRPHCVLMLTLPTAVDKMSRRGPAEAALDVNIAACCPYGVSEMNV